MEGSKKSFQSNLRIKKNRVVSKAVDKIRRVKSMCLVGKINQSEYHFFQLSYYLFLMKGSR